MGLLKGKKDSVDMGIKPMPVNNGDVVNLGQYPVDSGDTSNVTIKLVEVASDRDMLAIKELLKDRNIVVVNYYRLVDDQEILKRALTDLKEFLDSFNGDIVGFGESTLIVTPSGVKIDRNKIVPRL